MVKENNIIEKYENNNNQECFMYSGEYLNGKRSGKGKEYSKYGLLIFDGEYLNGKRNGIGKEYNKYGSLIFNGEYSNGEKIKKKKQYEYDKIKYEKK